MNDEKVEEVRQSVRDAVTTLRTTGHVPSDVIPILLATLDVLDPEKPEPAWVVQSDHVVDSKTGRLFTAVNALALAETLAALRRYVVTASIDPKLARRDFVEFTDEHEVN